MKIMNFLNSAKPCFLFSSTTIPVISLDPYLKGTPNWQETASSVRQACRSTGFFCISDHGVSRGLQKSIIGNMKQFYDLPLDTKKTIDIKNSGILWKGYFEYAIASFTDEHNESKPDRLEGIVYRRELDENHSHVQKGLPFHGPNPFLDLMPEFRNDVLLWLKEMERLGAIVSMVIADSLGLERNFFRDGMCKDHMGTLGLFHYPPMKYAQDEWGMSKHTDYGLFTLLMFDQPRLEVQSVNGQWISIDPIPNTFVVNIGDVLEVLTKGLYRSTLHRARNYSQVARHALPYFYDPNWYAELKPLEVNISQDEQRVIDGVKEIKRWDKAHLHDVRGIFGHYYSKKLMEEFPQAVRKKVEQQMI